MRIDYLANHPDLVPCITDWYYEEWSCLCPGRTREDFERVIYMRMNTQRLPFALVATKDGKVIGTASLKKHDGEICIQGAPWLAGLYVSEPWRGRGVGTRLVHAVEDKAVRMGLPRLLLYTPKAEGFYLGLGWKVIWRTSHFGSPVALMEKILPAGGRPRQDPYLPRV